MDTRSSRQGDRRDIFNIHAQSDAQGSEEYMLKGHPWSGKLKMLRKSSHTQIQTQKQRKHKQ